MANALYTLGREAFLAGDIDMENDDIRVILVDSADYTLNIATHEFLEDVDGAGRVATSGALQSKTLTGGVFDAADITLETVSGDQFEYIIIYQHTGNEATARLIACIDTAGGLPCTPNGGDVEIQWSGDASKIFKL